MLVNASISTPEQPVRQRKKRSSLSTQHTSLQKEQPERQRSDFGAISRLFALPDTLYCLFSIPKKYLLPSLRHWADGWGDMASVVKIPDAIREVWKKHNEGPEFWGSQVQFPIENVDEKTISSAQQVLHGTVKSPLHEFMPSGSAQVPFQVVLPAGEPWAVVVLCPGTADDTYFYRRKAYAEPLLKHGVACILPTMPFYGPRRPAGQTLFFLNAFSDILVQCYAATVESLVLLDWARMRFPKALLGISGMSLGGAVTQYCGLIAQHDLAVVPMFPPTSVASKAKGLLAHDLAFDVLAAQGQMSYEDAVDTVCQTGEGCHNYAAWRDLLPAEYEERHRKCVTCVSAAHDAWVTPKWCQMSADGAKDFLDPQARCHWVKGGHISGFLTARHDMVHFVLEALQRLERESGQQRSKL